VITDYLTLLIIVTLPQHALTAHWTLTDPGGQNWKVEVPWTLGEPVLFIIEFNLVTYYRTQLPPP